MSALIVWGSKMINWISYAIPAKPKSLLQRGGHQARAISTLYGDFRHTASGKSELEVYGDGEIRRPLAQASPGFQSSLLGVLYDLILIHGEDLTVPHHPFTVNHDRLDIAGLRIVDKAGGQIQQRC